MIDNYRYTRLHNSRTLSIYSRSSIFEHGDTDLEAKEESHKTEWPAAAEEGEDGPNNPCVGGR